ncbi:GreA/GreB family elongation factor [Pseudomonas entomophila]|uniref:GreA/GreB family elongation factor n=1 Tax=Pseudomonas entomophila TaxID=312306 RepID=UPI0015E41ACC|nr:GreA/GreB family elongation factor [Pseudomonas entomophila]MBA1195371.1 GreA/GreB family elongation factor [Pseudomonas entomophila]
MDKHALHQAIVATLEENVRTLERAAQTAYEAATAEENIAENKYDTLSLEASYLATGQARRTAEIRQALLAFRQLTLRDYDPARGIQVSQLVELEDAHGAARLVFLGPEGAGLNITLAGRQVTVITPRSPLGQQLLGKRVDDEIRLSIGTNQQCLSIVDVT